MATDWSAQTPTDVQIELQAGIEPAELAAKWFKKAKKLERGRPIATRRLVIAKHNLLGIVSLLKELDSDANRPMEAIVKEAAEFGISLDSDSKPAHPNRQQVRKPYRRFHSANGTAIFVGRGAKDNDALTTQNARPHDLWLHAKDGAGAHVVVRLERTQTCNRETLLDAATLAAHYSELKRQTDVAVSYTEARYVYKRKGSPAGQVSLRKEKVLMVRLDPSRLQRLNENRTQR